MEEEVVDVEYKHMEVDSDDHRSLKVLAAEVGMPVRDLLKKFIAEKLPSFKVSILKKGKIDK